MRLFWREHRFVLVKRARRHRRLAIGLTVLAAFAAAFAVAATLGLTLFGFGAASQQVVSCDNSLSSSWTTAYDSSIGTYAIAEITVRDLSVTCNGNTLRVQLVKSDGSPLGSEILSDLTSLSGPDNPQSFDVSGQHLAAADVDHVAALLTPMVSISETPITLTTSGNEITDATRAAGVQGDGRASDSSFGIWEGTTNLVTNGGFETDATGWGIGEGVSIARSTVQAKFGSAALAVVTNSATPRVIVSSPFTPIIGTTYSASVWLFTPVAGNYQLRAADAFTNWIDTTGPSLAVAANTWTRLYLNGFTPPSISVGALALRIQNLSGNYAGETIYLDGVQIEQKPIATPYVETDGATASRSAARVQAPASLIDRTQFWIAMRIRMGFASTAHPFDSWPFLWNDGSGSHNDQISIYQDAAGSFHFRSWDATAQDDIILAPVYAAGDYETLIIAGTAAQLKASIGGAAFTSVARNHIPRAGILAATFNIGSWNGIQQADSDVLWFATGTGTLSNTDAATLNGYSDPPNLGLIPGDATLRWTADTATAYTR